MNNRALVLEGGGMRGVFTSGVLDYFLDHNIEFPYVIGVSAGCSNALSYLAGQRGRALAIHTTILDKYQYVGIRSFLKTGEFINNKFLYTKLLKEVYPFDFEAFSANKTTFESVATNALTGEACYMAKPTDLERLMLNTKASGSLPFINREIVVDGVPMVDGGVADSIPLGRALSLGYKDLFVVTTQCRGFRKKVNRRAIPKFLYPKYPKVVERLNDRAIRYNRQMEQVEEMERQGQISVIRPTQPLKVGRLTTDTTLLKELYEQGYSAAQEWANKYVKL
ncbi:MAG: patatin family protein [Rikenellaceae bacterium]